MEGVQCEVCGVRCVVRRPAAARCKSVVLENGSGGANSEIHAEPDRFCTNESFALGGPRYMHFSLVKTYYCTFWTFLRIESCQLSCIRPIKNCHVVFDSGRDVIPDELGRGEMSPWLLAYGYQVLSLTKAVRLRGMSFGECWKRSVGRRARAGRILRTSRHLGGICDSRRGQLRVCWGCVGVMWWRWWL